MDELITINPTGKQGMVFLTKHGAMTATEIGAAGGVITYNDGDWRISFPPPQPKPERTPHRKW